MKVTIKGILFDMDGVLVSSIGSVERSWTKWAALHGLDAEYAINTAHGRRAIESIRSLRPDLDDNLELKRIEDWEVDDTDGLEVLGGIKQILDTVPVTSWTIVTSATRRLAEARLAAAGLKQPARMITADMVTKGKPDPEPYRRGAEILGFAPQDCLVIEDAASGARAGQAAGCKVLATTFSHSIESLTAADWIVESLKDVKIVVLPGSEGLELEFQPLPRP